MLVDDQLTRRRRESALVARAIIDELVLPPRKLGLFSVRKHTPWLDGLRGLAALIVLFGRLRNEHHTVRQRFLHREGRRLAVLCPQRPSAPATPGGRNSRERRARSNRRVLNPAHIPYLAGLLRGDCCARAVLLNCGRQG